MSNNECEHPERKPKDGKCGKEQIKKCHGEKEDHPGSGEKQK
ncbi:MAG: hypothetical protein AB7V60_00595 [Candidatus Caldatribacteriota bacterium]